MVFGGLMCRLFDYSSLIGRIESIFRNILSEEALVIKILFLLQPVKKIIDHDVYRTAVFSFLSSGMDKKMGATISEYLLTIYTKMRAKDFSFILF